MCRQTFPSLLTAAPLAVCRQACPLALKSCPIGPGILHSPPKTPLLLCAKILLQAQSPQNPAASLCENSHTSTVPPKSRCSSVRKFSYKHSPPKTPLLLCAKILIQAQSPQDPASLCEYSHRSTVPPKPRCFSVRNFSYKHSPPKTPLLLCAKILIQAQSPQNPAASLCENSHASTVPPKTPLLLCAKIVIQAQSPQNPAVSLCENSHTSTVPPKPCCFLCENSHISTVPPKPRCFSVRKFSCKHSPPQNPAASLCENSHTSTVPPKPRCFSVRTFFLIKHSPPKTPLFLCPHMPDVHKFTCTHAYMHTRVHTYADMHTRKHAYMHTYMQHALCACRHTHTDTHTDTHRHTQTQTDTDTRHTHRHRQDRQTQNRQTQVNEQILSGTFFVSASFSDFICSDSDLQNAWLRAPKSDRPASARHPLVYFFWVSCKQDTSGLFF